MNQRAAHAGGKWRPLGLPESITNEDLAGFVYAVVEERIDEILGLIVTSWPKADGGHPVFAGPEQEYEVAVANADLHQALSQRYIESALQLTSQRLLLESKELRERPIEVGDTFAIPASLDAVAAAAEAAGPVEANSWIEGQVIDITADAREAAKLATLRAVAPPLDPNTEQRLLADADQEAEDSGQQ